MRILKITVKCNMECVKCDMAKNIEECLGNTVTCEAEEVCFLDKIITSNLEAAYDAGCRRGDMCIMQSLGSVAGKKRDLLSCDQCCHTSPNDALPCNTRLCNLVPNVCMKCPEGVSSISACTKKAVCQDTEICSSEIRWEGSPRYYFDCKEREACVKFLEIGARPVGRRISSSLLLCSACCSGNECNKADCFSLRKNMTIAGLGTNPPSTVSLG